MGALFVVARNSSFSLRGKTVDFTEVARRLGVQYVLEGSVRKAGRRVRVTIQLLDAASGNHPLGRTVRSRARGYLRRPGRDHPGRCIGLAGPVGGRGPRSRQA